MYIEGTVANIKESFVDEYNTPLNLVNTVVGPYTVLTDAAGNVLFQTYAVPDSNGVAGDWVASISIPQMGLTERTDFSVLFTFNCADGTVVKSKHTVQVDPAQEQRNSDIVIMVNRPHPLEFSIPVTVRKPVAEIPANLELGYPAVPAVEGDELRVIVYKGNIAVNGEEGEDILAPGSRARVKTSPYKTSVIMPIAVGPVNVLDPFTVQIEHTVRGSYVPRIYSYKLWVINPSIMSAASALEDFINKARADNVIPELAYTTADLIQYLHRGLALFNGFQPQLTTFTGWDMRDMVYDAWLTCSSYYALAAQLQAEGQMAFDFSGQTVNLNVDRTPSIESALGRVESQMNDRVKGTKDLLARAGISGGSGNLGSGQIATGAGLGSLTVTMSPTTRINRPHRRGGSTYAKY